MALHIVILVLRGSQWSHLSQFWCVVPKSVQQSLFISMAFHHLPKKFCAHQIVTSHPSPKLLEILLYFLSFQICCCRSLM